MMQSEKWTKEMCNERHRIFNAGNITMEGAMALLFIAIGTSINMSWMAASRADQTQQINTESVNRVASDLAVTKSETRLNWDASERQIIAIRKTIDEMKDSQDRNTLMIRQDLKENRDCIMQLIRERKEDKPTPK